MDPQHRASTTTRPMTSTSNFGTRARASHDLRDFRDRDGVTPERFLAFLCVSAAASLFISAELREVVAPPPPFFLDGLDCGSLAEERRVLIDRFPASSSSSSPLSSSAPARSAAFSLPLPLAFAPVSRPTVVLVDEAEEEDRARFELPPAAETAVDDPEENDGDRSRVRRVDERDDGGLACTFLPTASLERPRDVPAKATSSFATV